MVPDDEFLRRFNERKQYLTELAERLVKPSILRGDMIVLRLGRMPHLTTAYFLLNDAYKARHMKPGHNTEIPKIAALTCVAIMKILPFRPQNLNNVKTDGELYCNELYALNCISGILGVPVEADGSLKQDFWRRLLKTLNSVECRTLDPFVFDLNNNRVKNYGAYALTFSDADENITNTLIAICELLCALNGR